MTWRSKKQSVVSRSSVESEYHALALGICKGMCLQRLLSELRANIEKTIKMFMTVKLPLVLPRIRFIMAGQNMLR